MLVCSDAANHSGLLASAFAPFGQALGSYGLKLYRMYCSAVVMLWSCRVTPKCVSQTTKRARLSAMLISTRKSAPAISPKWLRFLRSPSNSLSSTSSRAFPRTSLSTSEILGLLLSRAMRRSPHPDLSELRMAMGWWNWKRNLEPITRAPLMIMKPAIVP